MGWSATNYNYKTIACNILPPNLKVFMCIQKLDKKEWKIIQNHSKIYCLLILT
jgi:hypothetical protein